MCSQNPFTHKNICLNSSIITNPDIPITCHHKAHPLLVLAHHNLKPSTKPFFNFQLEPLMCFFWTEGSLGQRQAGGQGLACIVPSGA